MVAALLVLLTVTTAFALRLESVPGVVCQYSNTYPSNETFIALPVKVIDAPSLNLIVKVCGVKELEFRIVSRYAESLLVIPVPAQLLKVPGGCNDITLQITNDAGKVLLEKHVSLATTVTKSELPYFFCMSVMSRTTFSLLSIPDLKNILNAAYEKSRVSIALQAIGNGTARFLLTVTGMTGVSIEGENVLAKLKIGKVYSITLKEPTNFTISGIPSAHVRISAYSSKDLSFFMLDLLPGVTDPDHDGLLSAKELILGTNPLKADTDGDGLNDGEEVLKYHTNPLKVDTDGDGLSDYQEVKVYHTNPLNSDTDGDGLNDGVEVLVYHTNPLKKDTDGDGLTDYQEVVIYHTNPLKADTDGDGLTDGEEVLKYHTNPLSKDTDGDGLNDYQEVKIYHTNPLKKDTDNDGLTDYEEVVKYGTNPLKADTDGDGLNDGEEVLKYHTSPLSPDTDGDGLTDYQEVKVYHTNPLKVDSDGDGLTDYEEIKVYHTNPLKKDTDGDGLTDYQEVKLCKSNPLVNDTDEDGWNDYLECKVYHTNPSNPDTDNDGVIDSKDAAPLGNLKVKIIAVLVPYDVPSIPDRLRIKIGPLANLTEFMGTQAKIVDDIDDQYCTETYGIYAYYIEEGGIRVPIDIYPTLKYNDIVFKIVRKSGYIELIDEHKGEVVAKVKTPIIRFGGEVLLYRDTYCGNMEVMNQGLKVGCLKFGIYLVIERPIQAK